ncbi:MAG: oxidoreductase [Spirochaetota bacterium]
MEAKTALLAGSTGLIGSHCLSLLLASPVYAHVYSLSRRSTGTKHSKLQEQIIDFERALSLELPSANIDVYCCLGTTIAKAGSQEKFRKVDFDYVLNLGRFAKEINATSFSVVSSLGADSSSGVFYLQVKGEIEAALHELKLSSLHIFQPSLLLGKREETRFGEEMGSFLSGLISPIFIGGLKKYKPIAGETVAKAMLHYAQTPNPGSKIYQSDRLQDFQ